jgi:two-component system, OmpR family, response regulator
MSSHALCRGRVLVVDDEPRIADLLVAMLQGLGHTAEKAVTREGAVRRAASLRPDVVLLDATLPGVVGTDLFNALKLVVPQARIVVMTGDPVRADALLDAGASGYLTKPFKIEALAERLKNVLP